MKNISAAHVLFPFDYRRKVLAAIFTRAGRGIHLRELKRLTGAASVGSLKKELDVLVGSGLLQTERQGNQVLFSANQDHPVFADLKGLIDKTSGIVPLLQQSLMPLASRVKLAFVFGSVAQQREVAQSDVDVLVVGEVTFAEIIDAFFEPQKVIGREINPKVMSVSEWETRKKKSDPFVQDILGKPKLFLIGRADGL